MSRPTRLFSFAVFFAVPLVMLVECKSTDKVGVQPDTLVVPTASNSADAGPELDCTATTLKGPAMVAVTAPNGISYCIDTTEVTKEQYKEFYEEVGNTSKFQDASCYGLHYTNRPTGGSDDHGELVPFSWEPPDAPINLVSWCSATAYCNWAGKRLCGKVGGGRLNIEGEAEGPDFPAVKIANAEQSQWYNACSQGGHTAYATGDVDPNGKCSDDIEASAGEQCAGSSAPFNRIRGLYGGVKEWEDMQGYLVWTPARVNNGPCGTTVGLSKGIGYEDVGFRCCKD